VIAVSDFLRRELEAKVSQAHGKTAVIDCGVDLERFRGRDARQARGSVAWEGEEPFFLCVGTLDERKNVIRLADSFARFGRGTLVFVGDGPLREKLAGRPGVHLTGRVPHERVADWMSASDIVCQPSLIEPFGQTVLEALASERPVVATRIGGPPELVTPGTGVLVDPGSIESIEAGLREAAELPRPNPEARKVAEQHDVRKQARHIEAVLRGDASE
jgi:glycosyltransferase involved in cell wall biosynthesis